MPALAARLARVPVAATMAMTAKARAMRAAGTPVISLTIGEPDFRRPCRVRPSTRRKTAFPR